MNKDAEMLKQINRLQENLHSIRKIAGWTTADLGDKIGVTKQTISNIENFKVKLTKTQYIAIRAVLEYEIKENPKNTVLAQVVPILLDSDLEDDKKFKEIKDAVNIISSTAVGGSTILQLATVSNALLSPLVGGFNNLIGGVSGTFSWLAPMVEKDKSKDKNKDKGK